MLDDNDTILFAVETTLDDLDAPETINDEPDIEADSYAVEFDDLSDDSDDFHEEGF